MDLHTQQVVNPFDFSICEEEDKINRCREEDVIQRCEDCQGSGLRGICSSLMEDNDQKYRYMRWLEDILP